MLEACKLIGAGAASVGLAGSGAGIGTVNPQSGIITGRVGVGFTDINFIGTGLSITGYGSTIVVDISAAATSGDDAIIYAIAFGW